MTPPELLPRFDDAEDFRKRLWDKMDDLHDTIVDFRGVCKGRHEGLDREILDLKAGRIANAQGIAAVRADAPKGDADDTKTDVAVGKAVRWAFTNKQFFGILVIFASMFGLNALHNESVVTRSAHETQKVASNAAAETKRVASELKDETGNIAAKVRDEMSKRSVVPADVLKAVQVLREEILGAKVQVVKEPTPFIMGTKRGDEKEAKP